MTGGAARAGLGPGSSTPTPKGCTDAQRLAGSGGFRRGSGRAKGALPSFDGNRLELGDVKGNVGVASSETHCRPRTALLSITPSGDVVGDRGRREQKCLAHVGPASSHAANAAEGDGRSAYFQSEPLSLWGSSRGSVVSIRSQ